MQIAPVDRYRSVGSVVAHRAAALHLRAPARHQARRVAFEALRAGESIAMAAAAGQRAADELARDPNNVLLLIPAPRRVRIVWAVRRILARCSALVCGHA